MKKVIIFIIILNFLMLYVSCQNNEKVLTYTNTTRIARVTGSPIDGEEFPSPNNTTTDYDVGGTDLGIIWEMDKGQYGIFLGDTYGADFVYDHSKNEPKGSNWRCNVLAFSDDKDPEDGLSISSMVIDDSGKAREIIYGAKDTSGNGDWTSIPTAAVRANGIDYVQYMNIRAWDGWVTNHSGMYRSIDNGKTWEECQDVKWSSDSNFGQAGYYKKDGYVYMIGTETGRHSNPRLARFKEKDIENLSEYEYWNGTEKNWIKGDESQADNLFQDTVGELSFIYNNKFGKWIIAYFCANRYNISVRDADDITGPWSEPSELASGKDYPRLYGSYIHPLSADSENLYYLMSKWIPYNVFLMKTEMSLSDNSKQTN
jgi:hypothetical protein